MKGVILSLAPGTTIVDLTHGIAPQDIASGRFQLQSAYGYFPVGTVHVAVVDPGVGGERRSIAFATERAFFVGPDNGLLTVVQEPIVAAVQIDRSQYWRCPDPSSTFQGRDIFAAVAAHLCSGVSIIGAVVAIIGSHGFVEIAVNCGNAQERLGLSLGDRITIGEL